jgi:probable rRNA maturation factor
MTSKLNFPEKLTKKTLNEISNFFRYKKIISSNCEVLIGFRNLSPKKIQKLNNDYRNKNKPTDILSFSYEFNENILEGDLVLCWYIIKKNAKDDKIKPEQELRKNLIHGCLHLVGMEHSKEMFKLQADFLKL